MSTIKAISLWQPWASLIAIGAKQYETRSWSTSYRGPLAIHAAKRPIRRQEIKGTIEASLVHYFENFGQIPLGCILCVVRLVDVVPTEQVVALASTDARIKNEELYFGNYTPGRFAWKLEMIKVAPEPVPVKGAQGLWAWQWGREA